MGRGRRRGGELGEIVRLYRCRARTRKRTIVTQSEVPYPYLPGGFDRSIFNQLSGINAILYYLNDIFAQAGFSRVSGDIQAVADWRHQPYCGCVVRAMSIIDRVGRENTSTGWFRRLCSIARGSAHNSS